MRMTDLWMKFLRWCLRGKIEYLKHFAATCAVDHTDVCKDGKSSDFWMGKSEGIETALSILFGVEETRK